MKQVITVIIATAALCSGLLSQAQQPTQAQQLLPEATEFINNQRYAILVQDEVDNKIPIVPKKSQEIKRALNDKEEIEVGDIDIATEKFITRWTLEFNLEDIKNNFASIKRVTLTDRDTLTLEGILKSGELVGEDVYLDYIRDYCIMHGCSWQRAQEKADANKTGNARDQKSMVIVSNVRPRNVKGDMRPIHSRRSEDAEREELDTGKKNY